MENELHVVTGAFGYSGKYIARRLLDEGHRVRTLTDSPHRANPFAGRIEAFPYRFDNPSHLAEALAGASVLYNTYWVRFNYSTFSHSMAVKNTRRLIEAAQQAQIQRIVHISILNPSEESSLEYYRGKAELEKAIIDSGISYAILRPGVLFGREDILVNNIAWLLRRFPLFAVPGDGRYRLQPIHVDDLAKLAVEKGRLRESGIANAIGPETFTYRQLVETISSALGLRRPIIHIPAALLYLISLVMGTLVGDVMLTRDEIDGLMGDLLYVDDSPAGETRLSDWLRENGAALGRKYANEVRRRKDRRLGYEDI